MKLEIHPLYKRLMLVVMVVGPFWWLVFTVDGQRRTDLLILEYLNGEASLNLALHQVTGATTLADLRGNFPDLDLQCERRATSFGDRLCAARIGAFNQTPAHIATFYWAGSQLTAVQAVYRGRYHEHMTSRISYDLGVPEQLAAETAGDTPLLRWQTEYGAVITPASVPKSMKQPSVFWIERARVNPNALPAPSAPPLDGPAI